LAVVGRNIVFAGNIEGFADSDSLDELLRSFELCRLRRVGDIAGVEK
jgi:hypothetical protein